MDTEKSELIIRPYQSSSDFDSVLDHLQKFFRLESPMFSSLDFQEDESAPMFRGLLDGAGKADLSYVAVETSNSKIVGCVLASVEDRENPNWKKSPPISLTSRKEKTIAKFVQEMYDGPLNTFSAARILKLDTFSVEPRYRRQRLCKRMVELCLEDAVTNESCDVAVVLATSHKSQSLMAEMKFLTVNCCYFDEYNKKVKDADWRFDMKDPQNLSAKVMAKILTSDKGFTL